MCWQKLQYSTAISNRRVSGPGKMTRVHAHQVHPSLLRFPPHLRWALRNFKCVGRSFSTAQQFRIDVSLALEKIREEQKCDHSHEHAECDGRETRMTQIYTKWIAKIIMRGINDHVQRNMTYVNVNVMKRWIPIKLDEGMKRAISRDSENARSHSIKLVTASACACREPDALDQLLKRSLCAWSASRTSTSTACVLWTVLTYPELDPERLLCLRLLVKAMAGATELSTLGQFANNRIKLGKGILRDVLLGKISSRPPPPFQDTLDLKYQVWDATSSRLLCILCKQQV